jgi:hypothetical protein
MATILRLTEIGCVVVGVVAAIMLTVYQWALRHEIRSTRWEVSRFPLYAARDALVQIVAEKKMDESDPAWIALYEDVNTLLRLQTKTSMVAVARRYMNYLVRVSQDPLLQEKRKAEFARDNAAAAAVPEFAAIRKAVHKGVSQIVNRRATDGLRGMLGTLVVEIEVSLIYVKNVFSRGFQDGLETARMVRGALKDPEPRDIYTVLRPYVSLPPASFATESGSHHPRIEL